MPRNGNLAETVKLLDNVSGTGAPNQRALAQQVGISVGLLNALIHRAVRKGLIKIREAPARRYAYYLTPKGFSEKGRLVAEYLDYSLSFYRSARQEYADIFARCETFGRKRILLCGGGELAEIASLAAHGTTIELLGVLDRATNQVRIAGLPVLRDLDGTVNADVVVITDNRRPQELYDELRARLGAERVHVPNFLRVVAREPAVE